MYLRDVWAVCLRRWPVLVAGLLVVVGLAVLAAGRISPNHAADADIVLVPPKSTESTISNRFLGLGGLEASVDVLQRSMLSESTARAIAEAGGTAEYLVIKDPSTSAPILSVAVDGSDGDTVATTLRVVVDRIPVNLRALQDELGIRPVDQISAVVIAQDPVPQVDQKSRIRLLGVLVVGLLVLLAAVVAVADGLLLRRPAPRSEPPTTGTNGRRPPGPPPASRPRPKNGATPREAQRGAKASQR